MNNDEVVYTYMKSPVGDIMLARTEAGLTHISFQQGLRPVRPEPTWTCAEGPLTDAVDQLRAYFYGSVHRFDLPLAPAGTSFQQAVWKALQSIPVGETVTYQDIANRIGRPSACRAVGAANGQNPLPIVIPCHRVIGKDGRLTGYAGGIRIKETLLQHEQHHFAAAAGQLSFA